MNHEMESERELAGRLRSHGDGGIGGPPGKCDKPTLRVRTFRKPQMMLQRRKQDSKTIGVVL